MIHKKLRDIFLHYQSLKKPINIKDSKIKFKKLGGSHNFEEYYSKLRQEYYK